MKKKILSFLLAASMLFTAQGIPTLAGNVTDGSEAENTGTAFPENPVHHCTENNDGSDYTDWSYVYFGSYPQTEVTGDALTAEITGANYDSTGDAWVNGTKYRRASESDANNTNYFGDSDYRYFKWERIRWRVLENNGSTLFVAADQGLDCKDYNEIYTSITWEDCTQRAWLNGKFSNTAFSSREQEAIVQQTVVNENNPAFGTPGGNNTQDNVYLLSIAEVTNPEYGFCGSYNTYSASRLMQVSDYAHAMGVYTFSSSNTGGNANCWWWLRSPGALSNTASVVNYGNVNRDGYDVYNKWYHAVVPALHINLSSDLWYTSDDGTSGEGGSMGNEISITGNPADQAVKEGTSVSFNITANGGNQLNYTYQWYDAASQDGSGTEIDGATDSEYTIPSNNVNAALNGRYYYCVVSSGAFTATSDRAKLSVYFPPTVTISGNQSVTTDGSAEFSVTASGGNPTEYTYQWYGTESADVEGTPIPGAASAKYTIPSGEVTANLDGRLFYCVVSNGQYEVKSDFAKLDVSEAAPDVPQPGDSSDNAGGGNSTEENTSVKLATPRLTVKLSGSNSVKLSWNKTSGAIGYILYRSTSKTGKFTKIAATFGTSYTDKNLKKGKTYYYKVTAYAINATGKESNVVSKKIIGKLAKPNLLEISLLSGGKFAILWKKIKNAQKIEIQVSVDGGKYKTWKIAAAKKGKATYSYLSFVGNHKYSFRLRAYYKVDGKKIYSKPSSAYTIMRD